MNGYVRAYLNSSGSDYDLSFLVLHHSLCTSISFLSVCAIDTKQGFDHTLESLFESLVFGGKDACIDCAAAIDEESI